MSAETLGGLTAIASAHTADAPDGFRQMALFDPFEAYVGPFFDRRHVGELAFGMRIAPRHANARGVAHGGALLTFADATLGSCVWESSGHAWCVTVNMQAQFVRAVAVGEVVTVRPEIVRTTREIVFVRGDYMVEDRPVMTVTSLWKIMPRP